MKLARLISLALPILATACSSEEPQQASRLIDPVAQERQRLQRLQAIHVTGAGGANNGEEAEWDESAVWAALFQTCSAELTDGSGTLVSAATECEERAVEEIGLLCMANLLIDLAGVRPTPVKLLKDGEEWNVGAQSTAANAVFGQNAMRAAQVSFGYASGQIRSALGLSSVFTDCALADFDDPLQPHRIPPLSPKETKFDKSLGQFYAGSMIESYYLYEQATNIAVGAHVAVADWQLGTTASPSVQAARFMSGEALSRSAAAHLLVGGKVGMLGKSDRALCTEGEPSPGVKKAIEVLRIAAPHPVDVITDPAVLTTHNLLEQTGVMGTYSVRERLAELWDYPDLTATSTPEVTDYFGLTLADFEDARRFLTQEINAYNRSLSQPLPARLITATQTTAIPAYAATGTPPPDRPDAYWAAIARYTESYQNASFDDGTPSARYGIPSYGFPGPLEPIEEPGNLAEFSDIAFTEAAYLRNHQDTFASPLRDEVFDQIALFARMGSRQRIGRLRVCSDSGGSDGIWRFYADGFSVDDKALVMLGEDGLECAVTGSVEGGPCTISAHLFAQLATNETTLPVGFAQSVSGERNRAPSENLVGQRLYLVRLRAGGVLDVPGQYEPLVAYQGHWSEGDCSGVPIIPELQERVAKIIEPNPKWCARTRVSCAEGEEWDARLPLEDELSDDNDGVESSWRRYLTLAKQSAAEADLLGERVIEAGLTMDEKSEAALEELQSICGTAVDPAKLLALMGSNGDLSAIRKGPCMMGACANSWEHCVDGYCTTDPIEFAASEAPKDPEIRRLSECLSSDKTLSFVTPGTEPVCVWVVNENPNTVCAGASATMPCPTLGPCTGMKKPTNTASETYAVVQVDKTLDYFDTSTVGAIPGSTAVCEDLRVLRYFHDDETATGKIIRDAALASIRSRNQLHPVFMNEVGLRIGWEPSIGGFGTITIDYTPTYTTGSPWIDYSAMPPPPARGWPCDVHPSCAAGTNQAGLFCDSVDCAVTEDRVRMNDRLVKAVVAARALSRKPRTQLDLSGIYKFEQTPGGTVASTTVRSLPGNVAVEVADIEGLPSQHLYLVRGTAAKRYTVYDTNTVVGAWIDRLNTYHTLLGGAANPVDLRELDTSSESGPYHDDWAEMGNPWLGLYGQAGPGSVTSSVLGEAWLGKWFAGLKPQDPYFGRFQLGQKLSGSLLLGFNTLSTGGMELDVDNRAVVDGAELLCEVGTRASQACDLNHPPDLGSQGLIAGKQFLECVANEIQRRGALTVFANVPTQSIGALRKESGVGAYPAVGGEYGSAVSALRSNLVEIAGVAPLVATEIRNLGEDLKKLDLAAKKVGIRGEIADVQYMATVSNQMATCAAGVGGAISSFASPESAITGAGGSIAAIATCANSLAQISFAGTLNDLEKEDAAIDKELSIAEFRTAFNDRLGRLAQYSIVLSSAANAVDSSLAGLEVLRDRARRALAKALWADSVEGGIQYNSNTVYRRHMNTLNRRYDESRRNAVRMAFLAKRSIELRLGVRLSDLRDPLPLVAAPATWESEVCNTSGVKYSDIRDPDSAVGEDYEDVFIGSYVQKLENVVESYRLVNGFHEGTDTAVASIRDDIAGVRAMCETPVGNMLYHASTLDQSVNVADFFDGSALTGESKGWFQFGCAPGTSGELLPDCVYADRLDETESPFRFDHPELSAARAYRLYFGPTDGSACVSGSCGYQNDAALVQSVELQPGRYRLSWYGRNVSGSSIQVHDHVGLGDADGLVTEVPLDCPACGGSGNSNVLPPSSSTTWDRYYRVYDVVGNTTAGVGLSGDGSTGSVDVAGVMLENVSTNSDSKGPPVGFANTSDKLTRTLPVCEDSSGDTFRLKHWHRNCVKLCADGFAAECAGGAAKTFCYRETSFSVNQRDLDTGRLFSQSGFARGNFNYRIEAIGLNFVGTGLRDCSNSTLPQSCAGAGFATYSVEHVGPYYVRNHLGQDFRAQLFTANIEHARGLAAERYLTNPLSGADRSLIEPYLRKEFQGRPLDGTFVIRVWEEPGFNFDALQDVQVVLNYRYWTRFD